MKKLFFIILILLFAACEKEDGPKKKFVVREGFGFYFSYVDKNGYDLLDSTHPNALNFETMRLYYIENGVKKEMIFNNHSEYPRGIRRFCDWPYTDKCVLIIKLSDSTVIDFGHQYSDTICYNEYTGIMTYNEEIVWDYDRDGFRTPVATIVK